MTRKSKSKISIRYKITFYFLATVSVMVAMLWLFQVVFLDDFYRMIKINNIKSCAESITENIENENLHTLAQEISQSNSLSVFVIKVENSTDFTTVCSAEGLRRYRGSPDSDNIRDYYNETKNNDGTKITILPEFRPFNSLNKNGQFSIGESDSNNNSEAVNDAFEGNIPPLDDNQSKSVVYSSVVYGKSGQEYLILINSVISPVSSTVQTLSSQLVIVSLLFIILGTFLSFYVSRTISAPIQNINSCAKELAKGNFEVKFTDKGYMEVEELSSTLNFAASELSKTEKFRNELIANVSHDLRTPLTMISGYAELMRDIPGENTPENIQIIIDESKRLSGLVTDLLDISKMQANVSEINREDFNLTQKLSEIVRSYSALSKQRGYIIKLEYDSEVTVNADRSKISQVVYNLINNAINYCGDDKTVIVRQILNGNYVRVEIIDHGCGISESEINNIWDRYYKVDKEHRTAVVGTGLGLSIVKSILDYHSVKYGVTSDLGKGSTFYFELEYIKER